MNIGNKTTVSLSAEITDRRHMENALRRSEDYIRNILDSVDQGFLVIDRDFKILAANRAYCAWSSAAASSIIGRHCYEVSHGTARPCHEEGEDCPVKSVFETGRSHTALHRHEDANGNIMFVEAKAFPMRDPSGTIISAIETIQNITERRLLEAEQLRNQKLESIGTLAGGIAHDFNNLLQSILGNILMTKMTLDGKETAYKTLEQAEKALNMSIGLATQLLTFAKGGSPVKKKIDLTASIRNAAEFALSGSRCQSKISIRNDLWHVEADEVQIRQVIHNIILNACEAMPEGGAVVISAGNMDVPPGDALLPKGGRFVKISVKDSGIGIPKHYLHRIFDPYFTTKQKGSGLGLATSYSIIRNHEGVIRAESEVNRGSTFSIFLPAASVPGNDKPAAVRKGNILVMDDENIVMQVIKRMIETLGHDVESATNGEQAIGKFITARNAGKPFDIVILDLTIKGGMGGEQTISRLLEIDPGTKAIVSSGYSDSPVISDCRSYGFTASLKKPYTIDALRDILNNLL